MKKFNCLTFFIVSLFTILLLQNNNLQAQSDSIIFDTKGTDFHLAFLPNYHNNYQDTYSYLLERTDSIYIFIVADKQTSGNIEYTDRYGNFFNTAFNIVNTNEIYTFKVSHFDFELSGYNRSNSILTVNDPRNQSEIVTQNSFHITTDNEVTVYAHSQAVMTSDAFLVLPTDVVGREYLIMAYNSDGAVYNGNNLYGSSTPSQFAVVATEDSTRVDIFPAQEVYRRGRAPFFVMLNKGEVFLVQAKITSSNLKSDLTGTLVESDKPVAIFAGQQRTKVPIKSNNLESRDFLCEQMLPINTWGKNAFVIPYETPPDATPEGNDLFRVLAGSDGVDVFINGNFYERLNKGEFFEEEISGSALSIEATGPILVAQFKKTSKDTPTGSTALSDPFMMIVPPKEQFMPSYSVMNTQAYQVEIDYVNNNEFINHKVYDLHYISIVSPFNGIDKTYIDGNLINATKFIPIQGSTDYYYANIEVSEGTHRVSSSNRIGVYVYGYGIANSYGYLGGISMRQFDFKKPLILSSDSCYNVTGKIYDNRPGDSRISIVNCPDATKINVDLQIDNFIPFADSVAFEASLLDNYMDGKFEIFAKDSIGMDSTAIYKIPGFTVSIDTMMNSRKLYIYKDKYRTNTTYCKVFDLRNYGEYHHTISKVYLKKNSALSLTPLAPLEIDPQSTFAMQLCFHFAQDTTITDTLYISDGCSERPVMLIEIQFKGDDDVPKLYVKSDSCRYKFDFVITDSLSFDTGISSIVKFTQNCSFQLLNQNPKKAVCIVEILDPYKDAVFSITISDSAGNQTVYADTIQGFTLAYPQYQNGENKIDYGLEKIGRLYCDSLQLLNTGTMPFVIDDIYLRQNIFFSIPQYQFPMIINPTEQVNLEVCFYPMNNYKIFEDTLIIYHNCLSKEFGLIGKGDSLIYYGEADCDVIIKATAHSIDKKYDLEIVSPNPVINFANFSFNISEKSDVNLSIFDLLGNMRATQNQTNLNEGRNEINIDLESLPQGIYFYSLTANNGTIRGTLIKQ